MTDNRGFFMSLYTEYKIFANNNRILFITFLTDIKGYSTSEAKEIIFRELFN